MRLKSLHIKGFKSFADKTVVDLDNQITGIVGPNGCGKSNIVDAIRWVIGEHKIRTLRSQSLEDLIFNGSKSRSGSGLAEVNLTFENTKNLLPTEYNTVTIGRKFFKNGDSEYRLNDVSCRLKDITNLFLDTGITSDSYAIIELGMVDEIIKDKDGSRRRMLEQAAGISLYKARKREAENKLKSTQQDLERIEDLLFEISNNLRSLQSQAKKAEKYIEVREKYKSASIEFAKASLEDFNGAYQNLSTKQKSEFDNILSLNSSIATDEADLQKLKAELLEKEVKLKEEQKLYNELIESIRSDESSKNLTVQKIGHLQDLKESTSQSIENTNAKIKELNEANEKSIQLIKKHKEGLEEFKTQVENVRKTLDEKRAIYDEHKTAVDQNQKEHQELQVQGFDSEKQMAVAQSEIQSLEQSIASYNKEIDNSVQEKESMQLAISQLESDIESAKAGLQQAESAQQQALQSHQSEELKLDGIRTNWIEQNRELDSKRNEFNLLKELTEKMEGFPESIKFLKGNEHWDVDAPLLSEVFQVQSGFEAAIENYLDKYLSYYIVENREQARRAVESLRTHQKGKAGFFILSEITANSSNSFAANLHEAKEKVICDSKYRALLESLLENVFISESESPTPQGEKIIISKSGANTLSLGQLVGGYSGVLENNKIGRTQRLESLKSSISQLEQKSSQLKIEMGGVQQLINSFIEQKSERTLDAKRSQLNELEIKLAGLKQKEEGRSKRKVETEEKITHIKQKIDSKQNLINQSKDLFDNSREQLSIALNNLNSSRNKFEIAEGEYNSAQEDYSTQSIILTKQQSKINELEHEKNLHESQLKESQEKLIEQEESLKLSKSQLEEAKETLKGTEESLYKLLQQKETDGKVLSENDQSFYNFRNELEGKESVLNEQKKRKSSAESLLNEIKDKLNDMKLELTSMKERLHIEFKVNLDEVLDKEREDDRPLEELSIEVEKLQKRIRNLGEVNPMAVEAFSEMKSRHDFIVEQKADLEDARENLLQTIREVEETANQKFVDTFNGVRENFIKVFKALFSEDDACDLRMTEPDNPAETNVEIYAQPKGKNPKTITQLSGGERTLTSTAFLFAIYLIKPAPFCILDEVDAPLDDANVGKFMSMIRQFSDNSQFIIVTHNKQTMSKVDVIYGVTMQEAGVSKLVPVDFRNLENVDFI